jgi:RNA polymerase sigma-70 factor (ECF subfamily)
MIYAGSLPAVYWQLATVRKEPRLRDEEAVAERLQRRDPEAWAEVYEEYFPRVYRYVAARVRDRLEAEDLTETVFLKALEASPSFKWKGAPVSAWLFRIARNQVIDYRRTDKSGRSLPLNDSIVSDGVDPAVAAERNWEIRRAIEAVGQLTKAQRDVIELRFAGELSTAEVAGVLGKSPGAVKVLQHSALKALRNRLAGWSSDERED